jgi:outer membrane protein assembly factor BamB
MKPAWSYRSTHGQNTYFGSIAADSSGNLYATLSPSKLISLTSEGIVRFEVDSSLWLSAIEPQSGLILLSGYQRFAEARSMQDGHLVWSADLSEGLPVEHPDEGGQAHFGSKGGTLLGDSGLIAFNVEEGAWLHTSHVVALSVQTGKKQWSVRHPGHLWGMVSDETGNLYLSRGGCWAPFDITFSLSSDGQERWNRSEQGIPIARYGSSLLMNHVLSAHVLESQTGGVACDATNVMLAVASERMVFGVSEEYSLLGFGARDCSPNWTVLPARGKLVSPLLTTSGSVLVVDQAPGEDNLLAELKEIDANGAEKFACRLPAKPTSDPVLDRGRWVAAFDGVIHAFDAPELELARTGWVSSRGNLTRSGRPR